MIVCQAFAVVRFLVHYAIPVGVFAFCYVRIFHTIRRQSKVVGGHVARNQQVPMATTSRDQNAEQVQQQATGDTTGNKLSRIELNVLKTMITVIVCFLIFWSVPDFANLFKLLGVSMNISKTEVETIIIISFFVSFQTLKFHVDRMTPQNLRIFCYCG